MLKIFPTQTSIEKDLRFSYFDQNNSFTNNSMVSSFCVPTFTIFTYHMPFFDCPRGFPMTFEVFYTYWMFKEL